MHRFRTLIASTPSLQQYMARMWARHADALADAVAADLGLYPHRPRSSAPSPTSSRRLPWRGGDPREQVEAYFTLIRTGWDAQAAELKRS